MTRCGRRQVNYQGAEDEPRREARVYRSGEVERKPGEASLRVQ